MHPILAIKAFFAVLFGNILPLQVIEERLSAKALPKGDPDATDPESDPKPVSAPKSEPDPKPEPAKAEEPAKDPVQDKAPAKPAAPQESPESAAVRALAIFQAEGQLLDFLFSDLEEHSDEDIGQAVREVHRGCKKALNDHFKLVPVRDEEEDDMVTAEDGYDPSELRLTGNVVGKPPFSGTLRHKGWRATEVRLPKAGKGDSALVVTPAEVEIS